MSEVAHFEAFVPVLKVQELPQRLWRLSAPLRFYSVVLGCWIETPQDFLTDGCSIPRAPLLYLFAGGKAEEAGYTHDWLYTCQKYTRGQSDLVLREAVVAMGYDSGLANDMYLAVRAFGDSHWKLPNQPQAPHVQVIIDVNPGAAFTPR